MPRGKENPGIESPFGEDYAQVYDVVYSSKNYRKECDLIEESFKSVASRPVRTILDLGCGTGRHAMILSERGYEVVGVDRSEAMLKTARAKSDGRGLAVDWQKGDVRTVSLGRSFDAVVMMFSVLTYQVENADVEATFKTVRRHLNPGGLFLFDAWYGPAVLKRPPMERIRLYDADGIRLIRLAMPELDSSRHRCTIQYRHLLVGSDQRCVETSESHCIRYFFPLELRYFLKQTGLELLSLSPFPSGKGNVTDDCWDVFAVAQA